MVNGTSRMRASVCASSVLPEPVGPTSRMLAVRQPFVMIVDGDRENLLGVVLTDHVIVEDFTNLPRGRHAVARFDQMRLMFLANDVHAQFDALIADEHGGSGDQLANLMLRLAAE
jgi:hypothetical protein